MVDIGTNQISSENVSISLDYGPYESREAAHTFLEENDKNQIGVTVGVIENNTIVEYWYQGGTTEQHLVEKQAAKITVDNELSGTSENPVQNKVIKTALDGKAPATNISKTALASDVQSSLDKADVSIPTPSTGSTGQVLKKTANGVEWGDFATIEDGENTAVNLAGEIHVSAQTGQSADISITEHTGGGVDIAFTLQKGDTGDDAYNPFKGTYTTSDGGTTFEPSLPTNGQAGDYIHVIDPSATSPTPTMTVYIWDETDQEFKYTGESVDDWSGYAEVKDATGTINVNKLVGSNNAFTDKDTARLAVPSGYRKAGLGLIYRLSSGWIYEVYNNTSTSDTNWKNNSYWKLYDYQPKYGLYVASATNFESAIAEVPTEYRGSGRMVLFSNSSKVANIAMFNSNAYNSQWTNKEHWFVFNRDMYEHIAQTVGLFVGDVSTTISDAAQFIVGNSTRWGIPINSTTFTVNVKSIDSYGLWRIYAFYEDGTKAFLSAFSESFVYTAPAAKGKVIGISIILNAGNSSSIGSTALFSYEIKTNISQEIDSLKSRVTVVENKSYTAVDVGALPLNMGIENQGKTLVIDGSGNVVPGEVTEEGTLVGYVKSIPSVTLYLGNDLITEEPSTLNTGWSGNRTDGYSHASGSTDPLVLVQTTQGKKYYTEITITSGGASEGGYVISIGDGFPLDIYNGQLDNFGALISEDGGYFKITPSSSWVGTIVVKLYEIVEEASAVSSKTVQVVNVDSGNMVNALSAMWNVCVGPNSNTMGNIVNATRCIGIGLNALRDLKSGSRNIGIGTFALSQLQKGKGNIGIGADAYYKRTGGDDNVVIGRSCVGQTGNAVNRNVCIGTSAGEAIIGDENVCVGNLAGYRATANSVYIGTQAGYNHSGTTSNSTQNVFIGSKSGCTGSGGKTGLRNTCVGANSDTVSGVNCSTAIGYGSLATKSNQVVIGHYDSTYPNTCTKETVMCGDIIMIDHTDGTKRKLVFGEGGALSWETVTESN